MPTMKTVDLGDSAASIAGNVINYQSGDYRYVLRFPVAPATCNIRRLKDGRATVTFGTLTSATLQITGRQPLIEAMFQRVGGQPASD